MNKKKIYFKELHNYFNKGFIPVFVYDFNKESNEESLIDKIDFNFLKLLKQEQKLFY